MFVQHPNFLLADLACMLLSNLVKDLRAVPDILQLNDDPKIQGLFVTQLLEVFCRGPAHNCEAEYHFLGSVFADITRVERV